MKYYFRLLVYGITTLLMPMACAQSTGDTQAVESVSISINSLSGQFQYQIEFVEVNTPTPAGLPKQLLLFVHGTPGSLSAFRRYLNDSTLQDRYHMISVTRPGWVEDDDTKVPSLEEQARALKPLLQRDQSGQGAILMGHSYGGPVIAKAAMQYPDLVAGLVFVASTGDPELSGPRWYNRFASVLPKLLLGASLKGANDEIMPLAPQLEEMLPAWASLDISVLVVQGDRDRLVHPRNADFLVDSLVNADVTYLPMPGKGHFILWEDSELIRDTLIEVFEPPPALACEPSPSSVPRQDTAVIQVVNC